MSNKQELITLIEQLPEEKISEAIILIRNLIETEEAIETTVSQPDPLEAFMAVIVHSVTNAMYDLSTDSRRKEEKVLANRLEAYRKKLADGWHTYQSKK